jgi:hypothetical protein
MLSVKTVMVRHQGKDSMAMDADIKKKENMNRQ